MVDYQAVTALKPKRILVVGDFVLDTYTMGVAERISPEAPVAIVKVEQEIALPGMAGNVALNLAALGGMVTVVGRLGLDNAGEMIEDNLKLRGITTHFFKDSEYQTATKNRIIADAQQIVRIDKEEIIPLTSVLEEHVIQSLVPILENIDIVAISDYGKGFCTRRVLRALIDECNKKNITTVVDPKGVDFSKYFGCAVIKPNRKEAYLASGLEADLPFNDHAQNLLEKTGAKFLLVTLGEKGIGLFSKWQEPLYFAASKREIRDVTGAGDTVLATIVLALANGLSINDSAILANITAGIAIERFGCAQVTLSDVFQRVLQDKVKNKTYDSQTHQALRTVLTDQPFTLFEIAKDEKLNSELWRSIYECKQEALLFVILLHGEEFSKDNLPLLASLEQVDIIVTEFGETAKFKEAFAPQESYIFQNGRLRSWA